MAMNIAALFSESCYWSVNQLLRAGSWRGVCAKKVIVRDAGVEC